MPLLEDYKINIKIQLAAMWASVMFCYVYGDFFGLFTPNRLSSMMDGKMGPLGDISPGIMLGVSVLMAIPSIMVFLSVALKPGLNRIIQIAFGIIYSGVMILTMISTGLDPLYAYYQLFGVIETALTLGIVWKALRWPRTVSETSAHQLADLHA